MTFDVYTRLEFALTCKSFVCDDCDGGYLESAVAAPRARAGARGAPPGRRGAGPRPHAGLRALCLFWGSLPFSHGQF